MATRTTESRNHCAYCGHALGAEAASERFGERFCSEHHAEEFVAGVRSARMDAAARNETSLPYRGANCGLGTGAPQTWRDYLKRAACWGAPLLLLVAMPLIWSGGWAAAGGSVLSVLALVACPLGMYLMMRGMMNMQRNDVPSDSKHSGENPRA